MERIIDCPVCFDVDRCFEDVHFVGDALSARGITVSGAQGIYVAESLI